MARLVALIRLQLRAGEKKIVQNIFSLVPVPSPFTLFLTDVQPY